MIENHEHHNHEHDHSHTHDHHHHDGMDWGRVQAWIQTGILFLMGLYFIDLALPGGNLGNYINVQNFGWLTWVAAFIFMAIAGINIYELLSKDHHHEHDHDHDHDHDHAIAGSLNSWIFLGIVAVPLVFGLGVSSKPLGSDAIAGELTADVKSVGFTNEPTTVMNPENRNVLDWVRSFAQSADLSEFEGEKVNLVGFVYRDARFAGTENFMLVRFALSCCVADARPLGLIVENAGGTAYDQDTWLEVQGHIEIRNLDGVDTPMIVADRLQVTEQPEQPYLYF